MENQMQPDNIAKEADLENKKRILIIDDSLDQLLLNKMILEMGEYEVFSAESGQSALELLKKIKTPDLILLDMQMEDMSGPEFLRVLEETQPDILKQVPVVFLTGMDQVPPSRAVGFIRKPFDVDDFLVSVHHFVETGPDSERYQH